MLSRYTDRQYIIVCHVLCYGQDQAVPSQLGGAVCQTESVRLHATTSQVVIRQNRNYYQIG